ADRRPLLTLPFEGVGHHETASSRGPAVFLGLDLEDDVGRKGGEVPLAGDQDLAGGRIEGSVRELLEQRAAIFVRHGDPNAAGGGEVETTQHVEEDVHAG